MLITYKDRGDAVKVCGTCFSILFYQVIICKRSMVFLREFIASNKQNSNNNVLYLLLHVCWK